MYLSNNPRCSHFKGSVENGKILMQLETPQMATTILKLSGIRYGGEKLTITNAKPGNRPLNPVLVQYVESRWIPESKCLNLAESAGKPDTPDFSSIGNMRSLFLAISQKYKEVIPDIGLFKMMTIGCRWRPSLLPEIRYPILSHSLTCSCISIRHSISASMGISYRILPNWIISKK